MKFFRLRKRNRKFDDDDETPLERFFRVLAILLLFGAVVYGLWHNNERRMERLTKPKLVHVSRLDDNSAFGRLCKGAPTSRERRALFCRSDARHGVFVSKIAVFREPAA